MVVHCGDAVPKPFSYSTKEICREQRPCYVTYTNKETRKVIEENLHRSPLYSGVIQGVGPRYCPSIEDKIKRFPGKERHHVFLEPEGYSNEEIYPNGVSTSLPVDVQIEFLRTIKGLEHVEVMRPGYAIEYDFVFPIQLRATLETKLIPNLYHAGQVNGTSGYEEAAAQGLLAGINAALKVKGEESLVLGRDEAYIGVLIDDLTTKGTEEPYRMFTSRAEHRLLLRTDNADLRLSEAGNRIRLLRPENFIRFKEKKEAVANEIKRLKATLFKPQDSDVSFLASKIASDYFMEGSHLIDLLKRPDIKYRDLPESQQQPGISEKVSEQVEIQVKYEGYINRQLLEIERVKKLELKMIPRSIDYDTVCSLSNEIREKLKNVMPETLGQASRIPGVTPAAIITLLVHFKKSKKRGKRLLSTYLYNFNRLPGIKTVIGRDLIAQNNKKRVRGGRV
jgi:tRNA uridine 5-carboxymethylaminomethyl modification enzyme